MKSELAALITAALEQLVSQGALAELPDVAPQIDRPKDTSHGDLSCNIAMVLAKRAGIAPRDLATQLIEALPQNTLIDKSDIAGPGFINFFINSAHHTEVVRTILEHGSAYGRSDTGAGRRVQIEFVSANPTGPLHVGHGRGAAIGDSLSRLLEATGWSVHREFYYNDAGQQINNLALSVQARAQGKDPGHPDWPADGYQGGYIEDVATAYMAGETVQAADREITAAGDMDNLDAIREFAVACLRREQDQDLKAFQVVFDEYFLESSLYDCGAVEELGVRFPHENVEAACLDDLLIVGPLGEFDQREVEAWRGLRTSDGDPQRLAGLGVSGEKRLENVRGVICERDHVVRIESLADLFNVLHDEDPWVLERLGRGAPPGVDRLMRARYLSRPSEAPKTLTIQGFSCRTLTLWTSSCRCPSDVGMSSSPPRSTVERVPYGTTARSAWS